MTGIEIVTSDDAEAVLHSGEAFMARTPVEHNLVLTILHDRANHPEPGRYWMVSLGGSFAGMALQSPPTFNALLTEVAPDLIEALVDVIASDRPSLPGILGEAAAVSRFAGCWAERLKIPVAPIEALRLYRLITLRHPRAAPGSLRTAGKADLGLVLDWLKNFELDTGYPAATPEAIGRRIQAGLISIWEDGKPVSMASVTTPLARTVRVGLVYTPPVHRGRGYAASCVAAVSQAVLDRGEQCLLYTQLSNPQSNAIYRRLGYEPVIEQLRYRFG